jgi:hypothetical protein
VLAGHLGATLRAVPSTIRIAASTEVVFRPGSLFSDIRLSCSRVTVPTSVPAGLRGA